MSNYVLYSLLSPYGRKQITQQAITTSGLFTLSLSKVAKLLIPLPPLDEQARIVERVESLLAQCDALEAAQAARAEKRALFAAAAWSAVGISDYEAWHSVRDHFPLVTATPADVKLLREAILQLAVRGKLVAQDPADEPADLLLERIAAEKARLVAAGELKAGKPLPPITEDEIPYDLPPGWVWVRLGEVADYNGAKKVESVKIPPHAWILELEDIEKDTSRLLAKNRMDAKQTLSTKARFRKGDVLYGKLRPYLNKVIVADENGYCTTEIVPLRLFGSLNPYYLLTTLKRPDFLRYVNEKSYGMKMPRLGTRDAECALIPLPPLAEQGRIVERVESLLAQCDALETALAAREQTQAALAGAIAAG